MCCETCLRFTARGLARWAGFSWPACCKRPLGPLAVDDVDHFKQLLGESEKGPGRSVELLLRQIEPDRARVLRLCAIPHEFDVSILRALAPDLSEEEASKYCDAFDASGVLRRSFTIACSQRRASQRNCR